MSTSIANEGLGQANELFNEEKQILSQAVEVPVLPNTAYQLLLMSINDRVNARDVIRVIKSDPSLAARLIGYSKSAYFGYRGDIESVEQAVVSILGLRLSVNIAIGVSLANKFCRSNAGPMGLHDFWRDSIYSALLMQGLSSRLPSSLCVHPEIAYLCGLLHDFGILIIGQINRRQSILVNEMIKANPQSSRIDLEHQILGYNHCRIAASLFCEWDLPESVIAVAAYHHVPRYHGQFEAYVNLAMLADFALQHFIIRPKAYVDQELPGEICEILSKLNLNLKDLKDMCTHLEVMENELNTLAHQLIG